MSINISPELSKYMHQFIQDIIDQAGCRMPGSPQEEKAANLIENEMNKICEDVKIEPFTLHPRAFLGWIKIDSVMILVSISLFFLLNFISDVYLAIIVAGISFFLAFLALVFVWKEFFNYEEFIDPLFKKKESQNVVGTINAKGEKKQIIMFSGHHDSALQFNLLRYLKAGYPIVSFLGLVIMFYWFFLSLLIFLTSLIPLFSSFLINLLWYQEMVVLVLIIGIGPMIALYFFYSSGEKANIVPGAVDNLSAVAIVLGLGKFLKKDPGIIPKNTEIRLISFGSEEAGLRGAYRYAEKHNEELLNYNAVLINMDGIQSPKGTMVIEFEPTTRTLHSKEVVDDLLSACEKEGIKAKSFGTRPIEKLLGQTTGGTDATAFSKAGIKATTIASGDIKEIPIYYHQPSDTPDKIKEGALEKALQMCLAYLNLKSEEKQA